MEEQFEMSQEKVAKYKEQKANRKEGEDKGPPWIADHRADNPDARPPPRRDG